MCVLDKKVTFEEGKKILDAADGNINLIKDKYQIAKVSKYKNFIGFMLKAIEEDWKMPSRQKVKINTKFHNFESRTSRYSDKQLEDMVLKKNKTR